MKYKTKLKIGEFSRLMQVTVKTLRHYETKGLLMPYEVDEWTGYRYYSLAVFAVAVGIARTILTFFKKLLTRTRGECISLQRLPIISYDEV